MNVKGLMRSIGNMVADRMIPKDTLPVSGRVYPFIAVQLQLQQVHLQ